MRKLKIMDSDIQIRNCSPEMNTDQDWIRTEANSGGIRTGSDCKFFENWWIGLRKFLLF